MTLAGLRVLVVEDEMLISLMIENTLRKQQCHIVGPFHSLDSAREAAELEQIDLAVLDVNINGELIFPVAEILTNRNIPLLLLSGYADTAISVGHPGWPMCAKPFRSPTLIEMLLKVVSGGALP